MITAKSKELRQKRAELEAKIKAEVEKDSLSTEDRSRISAMVADSDNLKQQYELIERSEAETKALAESVRNNPIKTPELSNDAEERKAQVNKAFRGFLKNGRAEMSSEDRAVLDAEKRTYTPLEVGQNAAGYFVPQGFSFEFDEALKEYGGMLEACRMYPTDSGNPLMWPLVDDTANAASIVTEAGTVTGVNPAISRVQLNAYKYGSLVQVSIEQLEDSAFDIEGWLKQEFAVRFGRGLNADLTNGSGSGAPNGIITATSVGHTTTTGQTTSLIYDDLVDLVHSVDPAYRQDKSCRFQFHDSTVRAIRLIKDQYGHPIFQTDPTSNLPDRILGFEYTVNQSIPQIAAGAVVGLFGAMNRYVVRKVNGLFIQRLNERYAEQGLVGFLGWARYDGNLATASSVAITQLKMAAS